MVDTGFHGVLSALAGELAPTAGVSVFTLAAEVVWPSAGSLRWRLPW